MRESMSKVLTDCTFLLSKGNRSTVSRFTFAFVQGMFLMLRQGTLSFTHRHGSAGENADTICVEILENTDTECAYTPRKSTRARYKFCSPCQSSMDYRNAKIT